MANSNIFVDLFRDRTTQFGLDAIVSISALGNVAVDLNPRTISREDFWKADLKDIFNLLLQPYNITLKQVQEYLVWFMGDDSSTRVIYMDMKIKAINPNVPGNIGLFNQQKIQLRQISGVLNFILKNHLIRSIYTSLRPNQSIYLYEDEFSRRNIVCGIILLNMCFNVTKMQLVVNHFVKEKEVETLTLIGFGNNIPTFLTTLEEKRNEINSLFPVKEEFAAHQFTTIVFDNITKSICKYFLPNVNQAKIDWIKDPGTFDYPQSMIDLTNIYMKYTSTIHWTKYNE